MKNNSAILLIENMVTVLHAAAAQIRIQTFPEEERHRRYFWLSERTCLDVLHRDIHLLECYFQLQPQLRLWSSNIAPITPHHRHKHTQTLHISYCLYTRVRLCSSSHKSDRLTTFSRSAESSRQCTQVTLLMLLNMWGGNTDKKLHADTHWPMNLALTTHM